MTEMIWLNGETIPLSEAKIGVEDRGFQFADGVYEVIRLYDGRPFTLREHLARLAQSAKGIDLTVPLPPAKLAGEIEAFIAQSGVTEGMIYLQLTRGCSPRNHLFPDHPSHTLLFYARPLPPVAGVGEGDGVTLLAVADERWKRCWVKSIALLPNVLAKNAAARAGADEAVLIDDGIVTECAASNVYAVIGGKVVTHPVGPKVLAGVTRAVLLECAAAIGIEVVERRATETEFTSAEEVFISSTIREISWAARWNDQLRWRKCGAVTGRLHAALKDRVAVHCSPMRVSPV
jgi:D-alanine transaminase